MLVYVKKNIPVELLEPPGKYHGIEYIGIRVKLQKGYLNVVNLYVSKNCLDIENLPE